jgi:acetoacetyl-CoA reductase
MTTAAAEKRKATNSGTAPIREVVPPLRQRIAFVSGGMGGIGSAVCRRLARNGARVVAGCLPGYEKKDEWLARMRGEGSAVRKTSTTTSRADMFYQVGSLISGHLLNNAGITRDGVFKCISPPTGTR